MQLTAAKRIERRPGVAVLSGPADQLDVVEAAMLARGFRSAPEVDLHDRQSHGLPSHPNPKTADDEGAPNAGHTPGTKHPKTKRVYKPDKSFTFLTLPLLEKPGRDRPVDDIKAALDPATGWRLRLHSTTSQHVVNVRDPDGQVAQMRRELDNLRRQLGLLPVMGGGTAENPAAYLQNGGGHPAELFRRGISTLIGPAGGGAIIGSIAASQNGSPNMSVNVAGGPGAGEVWVPGSSVPGQQGIYYCYNDAVLNLAIVASDATDPRIDTVIAQVEDSTYIGSSDLWQLAVLTGTPTPGATLDNLDGIGSLPVSSLPSSYVLVAASTITIVNADILPVLTPFGMSTGFRSGVPLVAGANDHPVSQVFFTDGPELAATSFVAAHGPLFTFGINAIDVLGTTTGWYSDSGYTTPTSPGGAWVEYIVSGNGVYGNYYNPTGGILFPRTTLCAAGY